MACDCGNTQDFCVRAGETFHPTIRWGETTLKSAAITAITNAAPAVITATAHGVPNGWPVAVVSVVGMTQINASRYPPSGRDMHNATVLTPDTLALNDVNSADWPAYASGGFVVYSAPQTLTGVSFTMNIWDNPNRTGTPLATLTSASAITVDTVNMTITPLLQTAGLTWDTGYYTLSATDASSVVTDILTGTINIE